MDISNAQDNLEMTKFIHHSVENSNAQHLNETQVWKSPKEIHP